MSSYRSLFNCPLPVFLRLAFRMVPPPSPLRVPSVFFLLVWLSLCSLPPSLRFTTNFHPLAISPRQFTTSVTFQLHGLALNWLITGVFCLRVRGWLTRGSQWDDSGKAGDDGSINFAAFPEQAEINIVEKIYEKKWFHFLSS